MRKPLGNRDVKCSTCLSNERNVQRIPRLSSKIDWQCFWESSNLLERFIKFKLFNYIKSHSFNTISQSCVILHDAKRIWTFFSPRQNICKHRLLSWGKKCFCRFSETGKRLIVNFLSVHFLHYQFWGGKLSDWQMNRLWRGWLVPAPPKNKVRLTLSFLPL